MRNTKELQYVIELYCRRNNLEIKSLNIHERMFRNDICYVKAILSNNDELLIFNDFGMNGKYTTVFKVNGKRVKMPK